MKNNSKIIFEKLVNFFKDIYVDLTEEELKSYIKENEETYKNWKPNDLDEFIKYVKENK